MPATPAQTTLDATLKNLRIVHAAMMISVVLYVVVMALLPAQQDGPFQMQLLPAMGTAAAGALGTGQVLRSRKLASAFVVLKNSPNDPKALAEWRIGHVLGLTLAESVALFGLAIHFMGGQPIQVAPFIIVSLAVMAFWWPRRP
jgi:hypothetical protein